MTEKLKALWAKLKEHLKKISKKVYIFAGVALVVLAAVVVLVLYNKPYEVLVTGVSSGEASSILSYLDSLGVTDYKVENNDTILVPRGQEAALKGRILMAGYPQTGYAYSTYYDHVGSLSTEAERNNAYLMFLQESMSNTIRTFENVKDAMVYISPGEDHGYVLDSGNVVEASATVTVTMDGAAKLSGEQAAAIRNLVSHAVQGLEIDSVAISDTLGNTYSADASAEAGNDSALKLQLEEEYENKIRTEVLQALMPFFGEDHVRVSVSCVVDISRRTVNSRDVQMPEWAQDGGTDGKGIIGSQIYEYYVGRPDDGTAGGLVGSETNSDLPEYVEGLADPDGTETTITGSGQTDYDNSFTETEALYTAGYLTDCTVAISIDSDTAGAVDLDNIRQHAARAAGIVGVVDETIGEEYLADKISVLSMDFYDSQAVRLPDSRTVPLWVLLAASAGLLLFLLLLVIILLIRRRRRKKVDERKKQELDDMLVAAGFVPDVAAPAGADVMSLQTEKSMELRKDIRQFANDNPEIAAQMVRGWLRGGEMNG